MKIFGKNISLSGTIKTLAPIIAIVYPPAAIVVGEYLGFTGVAAAAAGAATINAATTLATGGTAEDALKSAAVAAAGAGASSAVASQLAQTGANTAAVSIGSAAAGGGAAGGVQAAETGQNIGEGILKGATAGAVTAGLTQGVKDVYAAGQQYEASQPGYVPPVDYSIVPPETGGGQGVKATVNTSPGYNLALTSGEPGIKATPSKSGYDLVTPSTTTFTTSDATSAAGEPALKSTGSAPDAFKAPSPLSDTLAKGVGQSLAKTLLQGSSPIIAAAAAPAEAGGATTGTSVGLTGAGGAGEIESKESGKKRSSVWNEESLRLKDALGV
jgi:uncharacterized membrane protein YtjA (UPF0391 family)